MHYFGIVENRMDPLKLGRCQVRIVSIHTPDKTTLPTSDLPWAYPLGDINSASMNGIGEAPLGPVEGTTVMIVFADYPDNQQPIMIGTLGGIPQAENSIDNPDAQLAYDSTLDATTDIPLTTSSGGTVTSSDGTPVTTGSASTTEQAVPGEAPFGPREGSGVKIPGSATNGILAVAKAMDKLGITASYARASILGIIGGESEWTPQSEGYNYSPSRIGQVFSWMSPTDVDKYAEWKGSRYDFFSYVYGPTTRSGKNLGNKTSDEGGKYYGRGYVQLTGAANYKRYASLSGVDIVSNPDLLNDSEQGALVAVAYFKDRVKCSQNDPGYFEAACSAVGYNVPNIKKKKYDYYRYFLANDSSASKQEPVSTQMDATPGSQPADVPMAANGLPTDRQGSLNFGFRDPNMKYPLRDFIHEPDTNRLARGVTKGTSVQTRDNMRVTSVPTADDTPWDQPPIPFNAKYPFNAVRQTESGHVMEFDDTPGNERINWMHRAGTFTEVDVNGTQVNRIVGDGYEIIDRNGYIFVKGAYSLTVEGQTNILISADANIVVEGQADIKLKQDASIGVAGDLNMTVGGDYNLSVRGAINETSIARNVQTDVHAVNAPMSYFDGILNVPTPIHTPGIITDASTSGITLTPQIAPETGSPINNSFIALHTPPRDFEDDTQYETPEEISTTAGIEFHKQRNGQIIGEKSNPEDTPAEETTEVVPNQTQPGVQSCDLIYQMADFPLGMKLSENFTLSNFIADPKHILVDLNLRDGAVARQFKKQEIVCNLKGLAENIGEKLIELVPGGKKGFIITSGYRYQPGSSSDHPKGCAMDIVIAGSNYDYQAHYDLAKQLAAVLPYHQLILEYRDSTKAGGKRIVWLHISHKYQGSAKMAFTMLNDRTYGQGFHLLA